MKEKGKEVLSEVSPPGFSGTVKAMKKHHPELSKGKTKDGKKKNPYALAWYMKNKGDEAHYKDMPKKDSNAPGEPKKKKKFKNEKRKKPKKVKKFSEWTMDREHPVEMLMFEDTASFGLTGEQVRSMSYRQLTNFFSKKGLSAPMARAVEMKRKFGQGINASGAINPGL